ncbi:MAG: FkbM family methyltransferase [Acidobacteria bacterium]|nr:FkbM family methyltransferase [Acidobacteriota bacterium]
MRDSHYHSLSLRPPVAEEKRGRRSTNCAGDSAICSSSKEEMDLVQTVINFGNNDTLPFTFRKQSLGDRGVIQQIFINKDYDLSWLARFKDIAGEYERILAAGKRPLILDCGANIGASTLWFAKSYPQAHIVALEPEKHNYAILRLNCDKNPGITTMKAAISCADETLFIQDPGQGDWGFRTASRPSGKEPPIAAHSIATILERYRNEDLFIAKIDIEGGESHLFETGYAWIEQAMLIIIELHDWLLPGTANSQNCLKALSQYPRDLVFRGENLFSIRNPR